MKYLSLAAAIIVTLPMSILDARQHDSSLTTIEQASVDSGWLKFSFTDPVGDNAGSADVVNLTMYVSRTTGAYRIVITSSAARPFIGSFRVNINAFNPDDSTFFQDVVNDFALTLPVKRIARTGINVLLRSWTPGQRISLSTPPFGNPPGTTLFRSSVSDLPEAGCGPQDPLTGNVCKEDTIAWGASAILMASAPPIVTPADFDGDGKSDVTVFRPSSSTWYTIRSGGGATGEQWGDPPAAPIPGDYDGDGLTDLAVFHPSDGGWVIRYSRTGGGLITGWGNRFDVPVPADYDGDGQTDIAVFRPSDGTWYIVRSSTGTVYGVQWGNGLDVPVPGDYDGDGKIDIAVFRPSDGTWYIVKSSTGTAYGVQWGNGLDVSVPGDYDGDGKTDIAVFRPDNGTWLRHSVQHRGGIWSAMGERRRHAGAGRLRR